MVIESFAMGLSPVFTNLARASRFIIDSTKGRNDFEVYVDGVLIFSKRRTGYFPDLDPIVAEVRLVLEDPGHKPRVVTETESCCSFRYTSCCQVRSVSAVCCLEKFN